MAIRDTLARLFGAKASIIGLGADEIPDRPLEKGWDDAAILSTYADDTWPYVCARILAENGAMPPLRFGSLDTKGQFTPVDPSHPVQDLFDHPNPQMTGSDFRHLLITYLELVGHAPIEIVRPLAGRRMLSRNRTGTELWPVNPSWWRIVANPDGTIRGYLWVKRSQEDVAWKPEQMTYLRWPNPLDRWYGLGRIAAVRQAVMAEEYAAIRDKKLEKNLGVPPGILSSEMPLGDPTAELLQKRWSQAVGGYQNAGKIAILGSKTTYQSIAQNARDAEWLATRAGRVHEITAAFGVPMVLVLGMKDATFANASEAVDFLWQETLQPRLDRIAEAITFRLLPLLTDEKLVARFDYGHIAALNENQGEVVTRAKAMADTGAVTVDEARAVMGMEPHLDKAVGAMQLVPSTMALTSSADILAPPEPSPPAVTPPSPGEAAPPKARKSIESRETVLAPIRDAYMRDLGSFFGAQRNAVLNAFGKATPEEQEFLERLMEIIGSTRFRDRLRRISQAPIEASVTLGATEAARALAVEVSFAIPTSEAALARVTNHLDLLGKGIENTTIADVRRVVTAQLQTGATHEAMRTALGELFDSYEDWRLDRIARTETAAAYNLGGLGQYRSAGVLLVTVVDGDADEICAPWNGREHVPLEEAEGSPLGHPNAVMAGTQIEVLGAIEVGYRANWSGPLVSLTTARDAYLAIGPNHPVLTSRGWLAAKAIRKGDKVVRRARERFAAMDVDLNQPVARIEHIFDALATFGTHARIVAAPTYFHGDGNFCEGEVEIVRPERPLLVDAVSPAPELIGEPLFVGADPVAALVSSDGSGVADRETVHLATAGLVSLRDARRIVGGLARIDATLAEPLSDGAIADAEFAADFERRTAIAVELDEVVDVGRAEFGGHAFDLQTTSAAYFANDILVHNCTRSWIPEVGDGFGQKALEGDDVNEAQVRALIREMTQLDYRMPAITVAPTPVTVNPTPVTVEAPIVNYVPPAITVEAPIVKVDAPKAPDLRPFTAAVTGLRADIAALKAEVKRPRTKTLTRDKLGRITGSTEE